MHKASIKKRLLPLLALLLAAGAVFLLLPQEKFDGERIARPDTYRLDIRQMTGTVRHTMALQAGDVLLHGHTHIPAWEDHGAFHYLNPGSVAIPKEGSWHGYMTLENGRFLWKDFDGAIRHELTL